MKDSGLDFSEMRRRLGNVRGQRYWRSLEELAETKVFKEMLHREFPPGATEWWDGVDRRNFLKMAAAFLALGGLTACTKQPVHEILPYVKQPEGLIPGEPLFYATAMMQGGFATGVLVKSREGHPVKIEGNPEHPSSLGSSSIWMQASILDLYDPDRSQTVTHQGEISTWALFLGELNVIIREQEARKGKGLYFLTETVTSPTLAWLLRELLQRFPAARWHQYDPISRDNIREGSRLAFGQFLETHYHFDKAKVILSLESDFLHTHPERLRYTRQFTEGRRVAAGQQEMNRLYVAESTPTITGSMAEHRLPIRSGEIERMTMLIARDLGVKCVARHSSGSGPREPGYEQWRGALIADLKAHYGASLVIAGEWQPPGVHALAHALNGHLGNAGKTVSYSDTAEASPVNQIDSVRELAQAMESGAVETLFILGGNPAYTAPSDFNFAENLTKVRRSIHLGLDLDETAALCTWHIPQAHYLESWDDARAFDGTVTIVQPLIAPLYNGKTAHELLGAMDQQQPIRSDYEIVRQYWRKQNLWTDFERGWRKAVHDGLIGGTQCKARQVKIREESLELSFSDSAGDLTNKEALELNLRPDATLWDGRFANNGWLQECPKPISKLTWDNAALMSPALAQRHGLGNGDLIELKVRSERALFPVWIMPGQAENSLTIHLGYGRERVGRVGTGIGANAYRLRESGTPWSATGLVFGKANGCHELATTQTHHLIDSAERQVYRAGLLEEFLARPDFVKKSIEAPSIEETLYERDEYPSSGYQWGMSIDLTTCIGCNACLVACEVENNIPVVGKDQIKRHREMFWIRVDTYYKGGLENPEFNHMPVPCMHCEQAPCELVCPVAATVHDHEGLNLQVYNRCVGTRFCSNNCPYKVRRFNFYQYTNYEQPSFKPMYNPEVTVRWRGVMEKCTYCIQRISRARIIAEKENRPIRDGEVVTACQQACPAEAIVFGNLNDPGSKVARRKNHPLDYPMLGGLNTRPRTTYLAKLRNPNGNAARV